jgi:hypothetical protein
MRQIRLLRMVPRMQPRTLPALGALLLLAAPLQAQRTVPSPLYMPRAVTKAFIAGARSPDGRPGPRYWQNRGRYSITVTAMPPDRAVRGSEQITYWNNSPDTLKTLVMKLFMNIHKPGAPREGGSPEEYLTSGTHIDAFTVNGVSVPWKETGAFTWQPVALPSALMPHDSVRLSFNWHYDLSRLSGREGMIDSTTAFLAYFYPRGAVYDEYNGWDTIEFTDQQEFYSDFNDYDVTLRVPANYVVWGTGTLVNPEAVLQPEPLRRFQSSLTSDQTVHVATRQELSAKRITVQAPVNSWHFRANNISDMAFAISDHYVWDAGSVVVDDAAKRRASVQAAYNDSSADYRSMVQFGRHALDWLSHNWPGVPYPYEKTTVVQGLAGMEYPMMANDESYADTTFAKFVAEHEIAHTYFPFYMGINESRYGFMDEGWATTFEYLIAAADMGTQRATDFYKQFRVNAWAADPSPLEDLPIITPADVLKGVAYGNNAYGKASLGYLAVKDLLGDETFRKSLLAFMDRWHGKHPIPWDFFNTFNDASGRNLNWFWKNWYFSNGYIDLAVRAVTKGGAGYSVVIDNIGGMAAPVDVIVRFSDGSSETLHQTPAIWAANQAQATVLVVTNKTVRSVALEGGIWVDANTANNTWPK